MEDSVKLNVSAIKRLISTLSFPCRISERSAIVLSGILGGTYAKRILTGIGITDPVTRGLAVGSAGQGLGVASLIVEPDAFPFAAMGLILNAISATVLCSIPAVKESLMKIALGK